MVSPFLTWGFVKLLKAKRFALDSSISMKNLVRYAQAFRPRLLRKQQQTQAKSQ
jgi:hypothetical protein